VWVVQDGAGQMWPLCEARGRYMMGRNGSLTDVRESQEESGAAQW
jgi:hypothetical protein